MNKFRLSELIYIIDNSIKQIFGEFEFWLETEILNIKDNKGNIYIDFVEFDKENQVIGKARGIIFDKYVWQKFMFNTSIEEIQELKGKKILIKGRINFHKDYGFSIIINEISGEYFLGQLQKNLLNIKNELQKLGIFENNKNLQIGFPPYNIAILSSKNSEGLNDFLSILNNSKHSYSYTFYDVPVHGNEALTGVYKGLKQIYNDIKNGKNYSFVIILRGGGGSQGIVRQNDINIAKGICYMQVPVFLAIGHTNDKSILDEICNQSLKTPSEAGYFVINIYNDFLQKINESYFEILDIIVAKKLNNKTQLDNIYVSIDFFLNNKISGLKNILNQIYTNIHLHGPENIKNKGYGVLLDKNGKILNKTQINDINIDNELYLEIYDKKFKIKIIDYLN